MNESQIRLTLDLIKQNGLVEVRVVGNRTYSGYFKDPERLLRELSRLLSTERGANVYFVINDVSEACYDREQQEVLMMSKTTTSDNDISGRRWILVDIDSQRASGVGATDAEKEDARLVGNNVFSFLRDIGFSSPISCDSGNGYHLLYPIMISNTPDNTALVKDVLSVLDMFFSTSSAKVDTTVFNASRITKLYGTVARKGKNSKLRPHRESKILKAPDEIKPTDISLLRKVAAMLPKPEAKTRWNNYGGDTFDLDHFISVHGIKVKESTSYLGGQKYVLEHCLFDHSHKGKDAAIFKLDNGAIGYKCFHNSCANYKWQDVRSMFEPDAYRVKPFEHKPMNAMPQKKEPQQNKTGEGLKFLQMHEIEKLDRSKNVYIPSHFEELDKKIIGFIKGDTSIWSGKNASGKSSVLGQLALNAVNDGFKVLMYSGELQPHRVKTWLQLQAAGRQFTKPTDYENLYIVPDSVGHKIDKWMNGKFFLYNNSYGSEYNQLIADLSERLEKRDIDMIILDNIMTLDLDELAFDNNSKQKKAILSISSLAKKYDVHIHIVAHPRKAVGFLRKDDIAGTADLSNMVENVFIVHRVNNDFIRYTNDYFGNGEASWMHKFNNVIETCKNRDLGVMDFMTGVYFEKESKRFLNEPFENIVYDWQEIGYESVATEQPPMPTFYSESFMSEKELLTPLDDSEIPF